ncbi:DnaB-like helicase C-terminal domain-containing protein [Streptomyces sp. NPDC049597]|uniref:DnaB-like helicase C-terminal domain-containing protein n=1 Tax=Streptomyces sp. NPDC049597 TaxID=3155276 RepID=UPI0034130BBA
MTPWPEMDDVINLNVGHLSCLGARSRSREAQAGYDIAVHNAARGLRVAMFAPDLTARNPVPGLTIHRSQPLTAAGIETKLTDMVDSRVRADLVVIDRLQLMHTDDGSRRVTRPEQVEPVSFELKHIAMSEYLGQPPVLLIARLERPRRQGHELHLDDLGIAAEMEYHADTVALLDRTEPAEVNVLVAKDRSGPTPRRLSVSW